MGMSGLILAGGGELDANTSAGSVLTECENVAVVTLAAAFHRPDVLQRNVANWAAEIDVDYVLVNPVRRADCLKPANSLPIANADAVLVLDGSPAHLVGALKGTPLLEAIMDAQNRGVMIVWSGAAASAVCDPMVDDRGGALAVGLGLYPGVAVATNWNRWPETRRGRLHRMLPHDVLFAALDFGSAIHTLVQSSSVHSNSTAGSSYSSEWSVASNWSIVGGVVETTKNGEPVTLTSM